MYKLECDKCGKEVEREQNVKYAVCFTCKMKRNREVSKEAARKKKQQELMKKKILNRKKYGTKKPNTRTIS